MMNYSLNAEQAGTVPTVYIAKHKSRIKRYSSRSGRPTYYLHNNDEFQIEIHNPTKEVISAEIWLNSKLTSNSKLVIQPGERVFLDRYLDKPTKYKFTTYEVTDSKQNKKAIENNGNLEVRFYREQILFNNVNVTTTWTTYDSTSNPYWYQDGTTTGSPVFGGVTNTLTGPNIRDFVGYSSSDMSSGKQLLCDSVLKYGSNTSISHDKFLHGISDLASNNTDNNIETGRVAEGSGSAQEFSYANWSFEPFPFYSVQYDILPLSQKTVSSNQLSVARYCSNCGAKLKPKDKFCSQCGTRR